MSFFTGYGYGYGSASGGRASDRVPKMSPREQAQRREERRAAQWTRRSAPCFGPIGKQARKERRAKIDAAHWRMLERLTSFRRKEAMALLRQRQLPSYMR